MKRRLVLAGIVALYGAFGRPALGQFVPQVDQGVYHLKNHISSANCDANGRHCDLKDAFLYYLGQCETLRGGMSNPMPGCVFIVPEGEHRLTTTVTLCRSHVIRGEGHATMIDGAASATRIVTEGTGFVMGASMSCYGNAHIVGIQLEPSETARNNASAGIPPEGIFGILMQNVGLIENVSVRNYVQGIRIVGAGELSLTNLWSLRNIDASNNYHAGIFVRGNDANAGSAYRVRADRNCRQGDAWKARDIGFETAPQVCAGVIDRSMLGNTWMGVYALRARDETTNAYFPGYFFDLGTQQSVCLGCFSGPNEPLPNTPAQHNVLAPHTIAIGGFSRWRVSHQGGSLGFRLSGIEANALAIVNSVNPNHKLEMTFGTQSGVGFRITTWVKKRCAAGSRVGEVCASNADCPINEECQVTPEFPTTTDLSLQYNSPNRAFQLHVNNIGNIGTLNFIGESGGLEGGSPGKLLLYGPYLQNPCVFEQQCHP